MEARKKEQAIAAKARVMPQREMATDDLFSHAFAALVWLRSLMKRRARKDSACVSLTNLSVAVQFLGERLSKLAFDERAPSVLDEEADEKKKHAEEATLADLFAEPGAEVVADIDYIQSRLCEHCLPHIEAVVCDDCRETMGKFCGHLERLRRQDFTVAMELFCRGARNVQEVAKRVVTTMQSTMPGLLEEHFGISLTSIGGRMGEGRQTTQARKKRLVETTLKSAGMKGFKGLGGARSDQHRERCKQAQQGNQSRAKGELRKRSS